MQPVKVTGMGEVVKGKTGEAIQKAIDKVSARGGGIVFLPSGLYRVESSIRLKSNIILRGEGRATVLKRSSFVQTDLTKDIKKGEKEVLVKNAKNFKAGMQIVFWDVKNSPYWRQKNALIKKVVGDKLLLDRPLPFTYSIKRKAILVNAFPVIYGEGVEGVTIENIAVDGSRTKKETKTAAECEGIQLTECKNCQVTNCTAYDCGGFGISCSGGENILFLRCESYNNIWHGFHVGLGKSGATRCTIQNCHAHHNDWIGIYICWNVTDSIFVGNHLTDNKRDGLLIGPYDDRNIIANNVISNNGGCGIIVARRAHPCRSNAFVNNIISNNGKPGQTPAIKIENPEKGKYQHLLFARNMIIETRKVKEANAPAIYIGEQTDYITVSDNYIQGKWKTPVENRSTGKHNVIRP